MRNSRYFKHIENSFASENFTINSKLCKKGRENGRYKPPSFLILLKKKSITLIQHWYINLLN